MHIIESIDNDNEVITSILFEEISYINDSNEEYSVVLGFPRTFMREPILLLFDESEAHSRFLKVVATQFDKTIVVITKDDMRVSPFIIINRTSIVIR